MIYFLRKLNLEEYIVILFPLLFLSGPFLTDSAIVIIDLIFLIKLYNKKIKLNINKNYLYISLYFFVVLVISAILSDDLQLYVLKTLPVIRFIIFPIALFSILNKKISEKYINVVLITFSVIFIDTIFQLYFGKNLIGYELTPTRPSSFFNDEQILGSYIIRNLYFLLPIFLLGSKKLNNKFIFILFISSILIILSKERIAFFYLIIFLFFFFFYIVSLNLINKNFLYLKTLFFVLSIILISLTLDGTNIKKRINQTINVITDNNAHFDQEEYLPKEKRLFKNIYLFSSEHENYFLTSINIFSSNKFFGAGVKSYRHECKKESFSINKFSCNTHPHNTYMQLLSEIGILGTIPVFLTFLFACIIVIKIFFQSYYNIKKINNFYKIFFILPVIISFFPLIPSGNFFNNYLASYYSFSVGIFVYYLNKEKIKI